VKGRGIYRDPLEAVRARVQEREAEVLDREERMSERLVAALPPALAKRLGALRGRRRAAQTFEELAEAEGRLSAYRDALDEALALAPSVEAELREVPATVPDPIPSYGPPLRSSAWAAPSHEDVAERLEALVRPRDPRARIEMREEQGTVVARFREHDAPFSLVCRCGEDAEVYNALAASVARGSPRLSVRPETWGRTLTKMLGLTRDVRIGEPGGEASFDGLFVVDAEREVAARFLRRSVRRALVDLAYFDVPTLQIEPGVATVRWRFEPDARALAEAVRVLLWVREVPVRVGALRK
jgi:hypothetical protein